MSTLLLLLLAGACADGGGSLDAPVTRSATLTWRLDAAAADLTRVTALSVSPTGELALAQPLDQRVVVVDTAHRRRTIGRDGEGPGEFRYPARVGHVAGELYVIDPRLYRVSRFDAADTFLGSFDEPRTVAFGDTSVVAIEMNLQALLPGGALRMLAVRPRSAPNPPWAVGADSGVSWLIEIDTVGRFRHEIVELPTNPCHIRRPAGERLVLMTIPFCAPPLHTGFDAGELVALVEEDHHGPPALRVRLLDRMGEPLFDITRPFTPIAVPQAALDSQRAERAEQRARSRLPLPDDPAPAATLPAVLRVLVGRDSTVWLELEERLPEHTWLVLAPDGTPWGTVVLPARSQLAVARRGQLWTLEETPDGFQGIAGFAVR